MTLANRQRVLARMINNPQVIQRIIAGDLSFLEGQNLSKAEASTLYNFIRDSGKRFLASAELNLKKRFDGALETIDLVRIVVGKEKFQDLWDEFILSFSDKEIPKNPHKEVIVFIDYYSMMINC